MNPNCGSKKPTKFRLNKQKGQLSVFLGISMTIIVTLLAFIINVGLFVKAKINLQNATDAAAWAGAAVQARQMTNIAYLNWEMRNNYKEWMFKSYVLGQMALSTVKDTGITPNNGSSNNMQFRGKPFDPANYPDEYERFNLPSICIHFGSTHNICDLVRLPGLPRFNTVGLPSISSHHESVLTSLVDTKAKDCSRRTATNFGAALLWAYGTGKPGLSFSDMPLIASTRVGAWVKGMELGLRMRNLEAQINVPPVTNGICFSCGDGESISSIDSSFPGNERPIKAFWSAFRSLGGGDLKADGSGLENFAISFKLTELEPNKVEYSGSKTLSNYLIPNSPVQGQGYNANTKYYIDLQAYPLNLVTFFTTFVSSTGTYDGSTAQEADCGGSKTGLPVPGFLFGFVKNPELMTYYAVKSEAKFVGLFNPFADLDGIKLNAYAAAKPFGGRIGPKLFNITENKSVTARTQSSVNRSAAYLSAPKITAAMQTAPLADKYKNGNPIPLTDNFWIQSNSDPIGGTPDSGDVFFSIPNLLYEFDDSTMDTQVTSGPLSFIESVTSILSSQNPIELLGLHSKVQFDFFKSNFTGSVTGAAITQDSIEDSINRVRRPTKYDAVNYLIPVVPESGAPPNESIPFVRQNLECGNPFPPESNPTPCYKLYAPLYGDGTLFQDATATQEVIAETIDRFKPAVAKFVAALKEVSESILAQASRGPGAYQDAADSIFKPGTLPAITDPFDPQCKNASLSQNFNHFFNGTSKACDITPIVDLIVEYLDGQDPSFGVYHVAPLSGQYDYPSSSLMTAYMPGPRQGAQDDGTVPARGPLSGGADSISARRSSYSTKFVPLERLIGGVDAYAKNGQWMLIEESLTNPPQDVPGVIKNTLKKSDLDLWDKLFF